MRVPGVEAQDLAVLVGDHLVNEYEELKEEDFIFDRARSMERLKSLAEKKRAAEIAERDARREERKRAREERRKKKDEAGEDPDALRAAS